MLEKTVNDHVDANSIVLQDMQNELRSVVERVDILDKIRQGSDTCMPDAPVVETLEDVIEDDNTVNELVGAQERSSRGDEISPLQKKNLDGWEVPKKVKRCSTRSFMTSPLVGSLKKVKKIKK